MFHYFGVFKRCLHLDLNFASKLILVNFWFVLIYSYFSHSKLRGRTKALSLILKKLDSSFCKHVNLEG